METYVYFLAGIVTLNYFHVYFVLGLDFSKIIIMVIIGQIKNELAEVEYFIHIYFLPFILLGLLLLL